MDFNPWSVEVICLWLKTFQPVFCDLLFRHISNLHPSNVPVVGNIIQIVNIFSLFISVYSLFTLCLLSVYSLFTLCLLSVYSLFTLCLLSVYSLFTLCLLSVYFCLLCVLFYSLI